MVNLFLTTVQGNAMGEYSIFLIILLEQLGTILGGGWELQNADPYFIPYINIPSK